MYDIKSMHDNFICKYVEILFYGGTHYAYSSATGLHVLGRLVVVRSLRMGVARLGTLLALAFVGYDDIVAKVARASSQSC